MTLVFPLIMIGGSFFPFEAMPAWMVSVGRLTPNGWALQQLKAILLREAEAASLAAALAGLLAAALVLFLLAGRRMRTGFARG
jgi:ABC-type multidrug transport system permease subunit